MWNYERRLQYPVNITSPNAKIAQIILSQYGGPDGEAAASFRYLSQRYSMPDRKVAGLLTDIGTEELAHLEMVASIVRQLTKGLSAEELEEAGFAPYYVDHTAGIWPQAAGAFRSMWDFRWKCRGKFGSKNVAFLTSRMFASSMIRVFPSLEHSAGHVRIPEDNL